MLIAAGAASIDEIRLAMEIVTSHNSEVCLMQCNTNYEGSALNAKFQNLNVLKAFRDLYPTCVLGLSCHMPGWTSVIGAVSLGARVIEKHFTDDKCRPGPDHAFAITPSEWSAMVAETRILESMLGDGVKRVEQNELNTVVVQQRCLRSKLGLVAGEVVNDAMIESLRPCPHDAIKPYDIQAILNKKLLKPIKAGEYFTTQHFE